MITLLVVVLDEGIDLVFEIAGEVIVFQQHTVLRRLMPAFELGLDFRMLRTDCIGRCLLVHELKR